VYLNPSRRVYLGAFLGLVVLSFPIRAGHSPEDHKEANADPSKQVYEPGSAVKAPKLLHYVEPEFSPKSKEAFVEGVVKISTVVNVNGEATELRVISGLNADEDRTAAEALKKWKFQPGSKDGQPVNVRVTVEVEFHLL
jgi:TonB family protein